MQCHPYDAPLCRTTEWVYEDNAPFCNRKHTMKNMNNNRIFEIVAVLMTAIGKLIMVNVLELKLTFILLAAISWLTYIAWSIYKDRGILNHWGFGKENLNKSFNYLWPIGLSLSVLFVLYGFFQGVDLFNWHIIPVVILYPIWGTLQQFLVLSLVAGNIDDTKMLNRKWNVLLTSLLFGLIHLPDSLLVMATTALAVVYTILFLRWRNLWVLGLFHGILGGLFYFFVLNRDPWIEVFG